MTPILQYLAGVVRDLVGDAAWKSIAAALGVLVGLSGDDGVAVKALLTLMCLDFVLGVARAWTHKKLSMVKFRYGFIKFFLYLVAIVTAHRVDEVCNGMAAPMIHVNFTGFLFLYLVICEGLSIFRHLHCFGVPIPKRLIDRLESLKDCKLPGGAK